MPATKRKTRSDSAYGLVEQLLRYSKSRRKQPPRRKQTYGRPQYTEVKGVEYRFEPGATSPDLDTGNITTASDGSGNTYGFCINCIDQGVGYNQRVGRIIKNLSLQYQGSAFCEWTTSSGSDNKWLANRLRVAFIWDKRPGTVIPSYKEIFQTTDTAGSETFYYDAMISFDNKERFSIVHQHWIDFNPPSAPNAFTDEGGPATRDCSVGVEHGFSGYLNLKSRKTNFDGEQPNVDNISTGALYVYFIQPHSGSGSAATNVGSLGAEGCIRLRYID